MVSAKYWEMLDTDHPDYVEELVGLINLSHNYDSPTPYKVFLDMIGWSETELGEALCGKTAFTSLDYLSLDYVADALKEYSRRPNDVHQWINKLLQEEMK